MNPMADWQNFYVILGAASGSLIGLQFVTMALIADMPMAAGEHEAGKAFSSPTIVHFSTVLLLAAVLVMPWRGVNAVAIVCSLTGLAGVAYTLSAARQMRTQTGYTPVFEDWFFRVIVPCTGYGGLAAAYLVSRYWLWPALLMVAAMMLLLLFSGIHSAWDNVTYLVFDKKRELQ